MTTEPDDQPEVSFTSAPDQPGPESPTDWLDLQVVIRIGTRLELARIRHRGPDSSGDWTSPDRHIWLGNTRLAIIDTEGANKLTRTTANTVKQIDSVLESFTGASLSDLVGRYIDRSGNGNGHAAGETTSEDPGTAPEGEGGPPARS